MGSLLPLSGWLSTPGCILAWTILDSACFLIPQARLAPSMDATMGSDSQPGCPSPAWALKICTSLDLWWIPASPTEALISCTRFPPTLEVVLFTLLDLWHHVWGRLSVGMLHLPLWAVPICCLSVHLAWADALHGQPALTLLEILHPTSSNSPQPGCSHLPLTLLRVSDISSYTITASPAHPLPVWPTTFPCSTNYFRRTFF